MLFTYTSNQSEGRWWLAHSDWERMAGNGWDVEWNPDAYTSATGVIATRATKRFSDIRACLSDFQDLTGLDPSEDGCGSICCGPPHHFSWYGSNHVYYSCSGQDCLDYMGDNAKLGDDMDESHIETVNVGVEVVDLEFPNWQPYTTAPRDGRKILVVTEHGNIFTIHYNVDTGRWKADEDGGTSIMGAWMPFPTLPEELRGKSDDEDEDDDDDD